MVVSLEELDVLIVSWLFLPLYIPRGLSPLRRLYRYRTSSTIPTQPAQSYPTSSECAVSTLAKLDQSSRAHDEQEGGWDDISLESNDELRVEKRVALARPTRIGELVPQGKQRRARRAIKMLHVKHTTSLRADADRRLCERDLPACSLDLLLSSSSSPLER